MADRSGRVGSEDRAERDGRDAFAEKRERNDVPKGYQGARGLLKAFQRGWDAAAALVVKVALPVVKHAEPGVPGLRWPDDKPLPTHYPKPSPPSEIPCESCRLLLLPGSRSRAVIVEAVARGQGVAYLRCRGCDHRFKLPVA